MPLVRIDLNKNAPAERIGIASEAVYKAMIEVANVPIHDKFQVVTRHEPDEIIYPQEGIPGHAVTRPTSSSFKLRGLVADPWM